jgi:hypothetical protein
VQVILVIFINKPSKKIMNYNSIKNKKKGDKTKQKRKKQDEMKRGEEKKN